MLLRRRRSKNSLLAVTPAGYPTKGDPTSKPDKKTIPHNVGARKWQKKNGGESSA